MAVHPAEYKKRLTVQRVLLAGDESAFLQIMDVGSMSYCPSTTWIIQPCEASSTYGYGTE